MVLAKLQPTFRVTADQRHIEDFPMERGTVNISYNMSFALEEARVSAGIDLETWNKMPGTPIWMTADQPYSKCHVLVWWRYRKLIEAAQTSAQIRTSKRKKNG